LIKESRYTTSYHTSLEGESGPYDSEGGNIQIMWVSCCWSRDSSTPALDIWCTTCPWMKWWKGGPSTIVHWKT